ncbi:MAG: Calx-beta domain-containing protein [Planctomycetaceae bacterium]
MISIVSGGFGTEAGELGPTNGSFEFLLSTVAEFDITVPLTTSGSALAGIDFIDFGGSFIIPAGKQTALLEVEVIDDRIAEYPDTLTVSVSDPAVSGVSLGASTAGILLLDNDLARISLSRSAVLLSEAGPGESLDVTLASQPTGTIVVQVSVGDLTAATVDMQELTFTPTDWNVPQTITLTAVDDAVADGSQFTQLTLSVKDQASAPGLFAFAPSAKAKVTVLDNEPAAGPVGIESVTVYHIDADREQELSPEGNGQRSMISHVRIVLDGPVAISPGPVTDGSITLQNLTSGTLVGLSVDSVVAESERTIVVLSFLGSTEASGSLTDGNYRLNIDGDLLSVDADGDGAVGGIGQVSFHRLFGDSDGDRDVDGRDLGNFRKALFARPDAPSIYSNVFDFDNDGLIFGDLDDYFAFLSHYGVRLDP